MESESHDTAQSRRYEAAESMLQHARTPRTQQPACNASSFPKTNGLENDPSQQLSQLPALPISPYPELAMPAQRHLVDQTHVYSSLLHDQLESPQELKLQMNRPGQRVYTNQQPAHMAGPVDNDFGQLSSRSSRVTEVLARHHNQLDHAERSSPVSSRGFASKHPETSAPQMRPLGKKLGKKSSSAKQEEERPPSWSDLKTKAGKERKRLPLACIACRRKKIRCSGEKPACKHCFRSRTPCVYKVTTRKAAPRTDYMAMLDKRLKRMEERVIKIIPGDEVSNVATTGRAQVRPPPTGPGNKVQSGKKRAAVEAFGPDIEQWTHSRMSKPAAHVLERGQSEQPREGSDKLPSYEIQEHLAEVYFDCLYGQSYLLLHKPSFMRRLRFSTHPQINSEPAFLRGEQWAAPAREIALKRYDQPSITLLTVLLILGLHEFGTCQGGRSWMFGGMAMRMAYALQLHREPDHDPISRTQDADAKLSAIDREIRRRTMWACFMMDRFNSSGAERPSCASEEHIKIRLPNKEFNFQNDIPGETETMHAQASATRRDDGQRCNARDNMGVAAYVVRVIILWGRVINHLNLVDEQKESYRLWHPQSEFGKLKSKVEEFKSSLPPDLQYNADNLATHAAERLANQFLFLHISYYQVVLFLHRYAIPTGPGATVPSDVPKDFVSTSAHVAVEAANQISELIRHTSEHNLNAPFAGYCAFTSSTVHIWAIFSHQQHLKASAKRNLAINIEYIRKMKEFWGMFHFMDDNLIDTWQRHEGHASRKHTDAGDAGRPDSSLFQYGDWFRKYPHGVSETDYEDPATKVKEEFISTAAEHKTDLQSVEDFFNKASPPVRPPQLYRKPIRKRSKPTAAPPRLHPPQVLPPDPLPESPVHSMMPMPPQTPVAPPSFSPHPPQLLYSAMPHHSYDMLGQSADMSPLNHLDRNIVHHAYAGTSGPSLPSADASFQPMSMAAQTTGMWQQPMGDMNAQAQAMGSMGTYTGDLQQSSTWFMPFNMPPPTAFSGGPEDGYAGYPLRENVGD
ncbi:MAG: hypothetical protein Q9207_005192, partial [Kuettlingeria erythrocarpa]